VRPSQQRTALEQRLAAQQAETATQPREAVTAFVAAANTAAAAVQLDEAETRKLIDQQLRLAGWTADSATLVYAQGARPEKNKTSRLPNGRRTVDRPTTCCRRADACRGCGKPNART